LPLILGTSSIFPRGVNVLIFFFFVTDAQVKLAKALKESLSSFVLNSFAGASEIKLFLHNAGVQAIKLF